jgi:hypothetical protein
MVSSECLDFLHGTLSSKFPSEKGKITLPFMTQSYFFLYSCIHMYIHCLGHFSHLALLLCTCVLQPKLVHREEPDLFTASRSPSQSDLCHFKVTVLAPLHWAHQTLSSFGFPTFPYSSCMCSPLSMWPKSNCITAFVLDLKSTYETEHMIFWLSESG